MRYNPTANELDIVKRAIRAAVAHGGMVWGTVSALANTKDWCCDTNENGIKWFDKVYLPSWAWGNSTEIYIGEITVKGCYTYQWGLVNGKSVKRFHNPQKPEYCWITYGIRNDGSLCCWAS